MQKKIVTINSRKFDGRIHRSWKAELISAENSLLTFIGVFEQEVKHSKLGVIRRGTISYEFYWLDRWFNVFRFHEPEGNLRNFYCNLNLPPVYDNNELNYIDLDIDLLVSSDLKTEVLDLDEFNENALIFKYSEELKNKTLQTLDEVIMLVESRTFPFD